MLKHVITFVLLAAAPYVLSATTPKDSHAFAFGENVSDGFKEPLSSGFKGALTSAVGANSTNGSSKGWTANQLRRRLALTVREDVVLGVQSSSINLGVNNGPTDDNTIYQFRITPSMTVGTTISCTLTCGSLCGSALIVWKTGSAMADLSKDRDSFITGSGVPLTAVIQYAITGTLYVAVAEDTSGIGNGRITCSGVPTASPTPVPTASPTRAPTPAPGSPTLPPTGVPTRAPTPAPTAPTLAPTLPPAPAPAPAPCSERVYNFVRGQYVRLQTRWGGGGEGEI